MTVDETQAQGEPVVENDASEAIAQESHETAQAPDPLAGLRSQFADLGQDITVENAASKVADMRRAMYEAQEKASLAQKQIEAIKAEQNQPQHEDYRIDDPYQTLYRPTRSNPNQVPQAAPQTNTELARLKAQLNKIEADNKMAALRSEFPQDISPETESMIRLRMVETNIPDPRYHFMALMGERKIREASTKATEAASKAAAIRDAKRNATDMPQSQSQSISGSNAPIDVSGLKGPELARKQLEIVQKHMKS